jgi:energy-coupling factor transport system permease protein
LIRLGPLQWGNFSLGPLVVDRASAQLGLRTSTLIFTVIHSVNLVLITTTPEDLVWGLSWYLKPFAVFGLPVESWDFNCYWRCAFCLSFKRSFKTCFVRWQAEP